MQGHQKEEKMDCRAPLRKLLKHMLHLGAESRPEDRTAPQGGQSFPGGRGGGGEEKGEGPAQAPEQGGRVQPGRAQVGAGR